MTVGTVTCAIQACSVDAALAGRRLSLLRFAPRAVIVTLARTKTTSGLRVAAVRVKLSRALLRKLRSGHRDRTLRLSVVVTAAGRATVAKRGKLRVSPR